MLLLAASGCSSGQGRIHTGATAVLSACLHRSDCTGAQGLRLMSLGFKLQKSEKWNKQHVKLTEAPWCEVLALLLLSLVLAWMMGICVLLRLLCAPTVPCSKRQRFPLSRCSGLAASAALCLGRRELQPWAARTSMRVEGLQAKPSSGKARGGVGRGSPSPRLVLFEHCLAHFFYFSKYEVSLSFYSLSSLLSTASNQMSSRDKTINTQCLYLAGCQVCMPSKYLRQKNLNRQYLLYFLC